MTDRKDNRIDPLADVEDDASGLESFFSEARAEPPLPAGDFMVRMEALAVAEQPSPGACALPSARPRQRVGQQLRAALGGWMGMAGLATAGAAGLWIGISPPESLSVFWGVDSAGLGTLGVDPLSGFDLSLLEG